MSKSKGKVIPKDLHKKTYELDGPRNFKNLYIS